MSLKRLFVLSSHYRGNMMIIEWVL